MNQKDLTRDVVNKLRIDGYRKRVTFPKHTFHISDSDGNHKDFSVRKSDRKVMLTYEDVYSVIDAFVYSIKECIKRGDNVKIKGLGTIGSGFRKERRTRDFQTDEWIVIPGHYIPKFSPSSDLKTCVKLYELSLADGESGSTDVNTVVARFESQDDDDEDFDGEYGEDEVATDIDDSDQDDEDDGEDVLSLGGDK